MAENSYGKGALFFSYMNHALDGQLTDFLKEFFKAYRFKVYSEEDFFVALDSYIKKHNIDLNLADAYRKIRTVN